MNYKINIFFSEKLTTYLIKMFIINIYIDLDKK